MQALLIAHITLLSLSLLATSGFILASILGKPVASLFRQLNLFVTVIGLGCGGLLLAAKPIGGECLLLLSYLGLFAFAHHYITCASRRLQLSN